MTSCCVKSCPSRPGCRGVSFFRFPVARNVPVIRRRNAWLEAIGDQGLDLEGAFICSRHFLYGRPAKLEEPDHPDWVPTLAMGEADEEEFDVESSIKASLITSMQVKEAITKDLSEMCRLCLGKEEKLTNSFRDGTGTNGALLKQIYDCTTVKVTLKATYPGAICAACYAKLDEYSKFRKKCIENDGILRMIMGNVDDEKNKVGTSDQTTDSQSEFADPEATSSSTVVAASTVPVPKEPIIAAENLATTNVSVAAPKTVNVMSNITSSGHKDGLQGKVLQNGRPKCGICSRSFVNKQTLHRHMKIHTGEMYTCEYCGKKFNHRPNLKIHLRVHTGENLTRCAVCFKTFTLPSILKYHLRVHRKLKVLECRLCAETAKTYEELATHVATKHDHVLTNSNIDGPFLAADFFETSTISETPAGLPGEIEINEQFLEGGPVQTDLDGGNQEQWQPTAEQEAPLQHILFRCYYCMETFEHPYSLRVHMMMHNNIN